MFQPSIHFLPLIQLRVMVRDSLSAVIGHEISKLTKWLTFEWIWCCILIQQFWGWFYTLTRCVQTESFGHIFTNIYQIEIVNVGGRCYDVFKRISKMQVQVYFRVHVLTHDIFSLALGLTFEKSLLSHVFLFALCSNIPCTFYHSQLFPLINN